jgi:hypothetical protein
MSAIDTKDTHDAARDRDARLENFTAELTRAVYPIVLRRGPRESWLEVELSLWKALEEAVEKWARKPPPAASDDLDAWREDLLVELTVSALYVALKCGIQAPLLELERGLSAAIRQVIGRFSHVS